MKEVGRLPGSRRKLYKYFRDPSGWLTQGGGGGDEMYGLNGGWGYGNEWFGDANRIVACNGTVECRILDAKPPAYANFDLGDARRNGYTR